MTRHLTVAERLAADERDVHLHDIAATSTWDQVLVEQAVLLFGCRMTKFSANNLRELLPEMGHGYLGAAINSLRTGGVIESTGQWVPSTSGPTKGHRIAVWTLTPRGQQIARDRSARREAAA